MVKYSRLQRASNLLPYERLMGGVLYGRDQKAFCLVTGESSWLIHFYGRLMQVVTAIVNTWRRSRYTYLRWRGKVNPDPFSRVGWKVKMEYRALQPLHKINVTVVDDD